MITKEQGKEEIKKLVDKYNKLIESGKAKSYNEEMTKKDFILPLFRALGWSVEDGDEVTAEEKISKGRVDYAFRIDGIPKLFLEAKSLREDLDRKEFAEQAINYAWHKGATWAILTDFEGVKVFNAEWKSVNYLQNQFFSINCNRFLDNFEQLWLLSRESLEQGLIDKEAEKWGKKAKKIPVDKQLLNDLTRFRELLTKNILKNNPSKNLTEEELEEAVQRIIDRLIFIRTLEDKQLEAPILQSLIRENINKRVSKKLNDVFRNIDDIYNSKLFTPHLCEELVIDDEVLEKIIYGLFKTADNTVHYDFSAIDADVLGNIYEQYLGHILKKTAKRATLTEGKAYRKEQGIYYTPTYVVDYIVKNTIGELAKDKKFDLKNIKVLDPACGSGSFLMKAFDYLVTLDKKKNGEIAQTKLDLTGASVSYGRRVEILKENIFGVDLDTKAVEIAPLNLLLKTAEKKHRLPTLQENIKVGNSLIDDPSVAGDRAFKWEDEFKDVMKNGGFDIVIGNPPWLMAGYHTTSKEIDYLHEKYESAKGKFDLYYCFIEKALKLISNKGIFGMIVPNKFFHTKSAKGLREILMKSGKLYKIVDFGDEKVFGDATNYSSILLLKPGSHKKITYTEVDAGLNIKKEIQTDIQSLTAEGWYFEDKIEKSLFDKINTIGTPLIQLTKRFGTGVQTGADKVFLITEENIKEFGAENKIFCKIFRGRDVRRYSISKITKLAIFPYKVVNNKFEIFEEDEIKKYKKVWQILESNKNNLSKRIWFGKNATQLSGKYYGFMYLDDYSNFKTPHILTPSLSDQSNFSIGTGNVFVTGTAGVTSIILKPIFEDINYILGLLNSKLISFYVIKHSPVFQGGYHKFSSNYLKKIPIKRIDMNKSSEKEIHSSIIKSVNKMLSLNKRLNEIKDKQTDEKTRIEKEIQKIDDEIDQEVYKLYGITKEEQKIIEESLK